MSDADDLVARLRAGGPDLANPPRPALAEPETVEHVAVLWAAATGWKPGRHPTPPAHALVPLIARWCEAQGWGAEPTHRQVGRGLVGAGWKRRQRGGFLGYLVDSATAERLWEAALLAGLRPEHSPQHKARRKRGARALKVRPLFFEELHKSGRCGGTRKPVVDSTHCVYPSAAVAGRMRGLAPPTISHAAHRGVVAGGRRWRLLSPAEYASLPADARAGDCIPDIRW